MTLGGLEWVCIRWLAYCTCVALSFFTIYFQLTMDLLLAAGGSDDSYDYDDFSIDGMDSILVQAVPSGDLDVPGDLDVFGSALQITSLVDLNLDLRSASTASNGPKR
jgi:hypothetical protein